MCCQSHSEANALSTQKMMINLIFHVCLSADLQKINLYANNSLTSKTISYTSNTEFCKILMIKYIYGLFWGRLWTWMMTEVSQGCEWLHGNWDQEEMLCGVQSWHPLYNSSHLLLYTLWGFSLLPFERNWKSHDFWVLITNIGIFKNTMRIKCLQAFL